MSQLHLHVSNRLDLLARALAQAVAEPLPSPFTPEKVIVQSAAAGRWLGLRLAEFTGICANYEFPFLSQIITSLLADGRHGTPAIERPKVELLAWRIDSALRHCSGEPEFVGVARYLADGDHAITFLAYPDFDTSPHPALVNATKINLRTGTVVRTDFRQRANPPILHRKESFLPPNDPRRSEFAALTRQEEEHGLYREPAKIGLRTYWQTLLVRLGLKYEGHRLVSVRADPSETEEPSMEQAEVVARHRTAIKRYDLSRPVKRLLECGLLRKGNTFFDYGCGHGMDIEGLTSMGYQAAGWDPAFRPSEPKTPASVVNLGFVLNVIERPEERVATPPPNRHTEEAQVG